MGLLTGDIPPDVSDRLAVESSIKGVDYIKVPHHGSKSALSERFYNLVRPQIAVISVGKNSYGQPSNEVIKLLTDMEIKVLRTDEMGDIVIETDGKRMWED